METTAATSNVCGGLAEDVKPGDRILIDDGLIELHVPGGQWNRHRLPD